MKETKKTLKTCLKRAPGVMLLCGERLYERPRHHCLYCGGSECADV